MQSPTTLYGFQVGIRSGDDGAFFHSRQAADRFAAWLGWDTDNICTRKPVDCRLEEIGDTPDEPWQTPDEPQVFLIPEMAENRFDPTGWGTESPDTSPY